MIRNLHDSVWHFAFRRWFDNREAGKTRSAEAWGWVADRIVRNY